MSFLKPLSDVELIEMRDRLERKVLDQGYLHCIAQTRIALRDVYSELERRPGNLLEADASTGRVVFRGE